MVPQYMVASVRKLPYLVSTVTAVLVDTPGNQAPVIADVWRYAMAAACLAAIEVLLEEPQIIDRLWENTCFFKSGLQGLGFNTGVSESPITPVIVGDAALAMTLSDRLFAEGVFAQGIGFPTVARDKARVRTIVTATHTRDELQFALDAFGRVGGSLGIL